MTSIQNNPVVAAAANAIAREIVKAVLPFARFCATPCTIDQAAMQRFCGTPVPVRCGMPVTPRPVCTMPAQPQGIWAGHDGKGCVRDIPVQWPPCGGGFRPAPLPPFCTPAPDGMVVTKPACGGKAEIDLGDGYTMTLNERSSEIVITDANGDKTRIWGDPHVDVNGKRVGDFYDTTTFELKNGTKITINTEPWKAGGNGAYVASQVVITKGDQGIVVDGISQNEKGDLKITQGYDGQALDFAHDDGFNLTEAGDKGTYGWNSEFTGERVTKAEMKEMTLHKNEAKREALEMQRDLGNAFVSWLFFGDLGGMMSLAGSESFERAVRDDLQEQPGYRFFEALMGVRDRGPAGIDD